MPVKILIVDDSPLLHRMYDLALRAYEGANIEPLFARDGAEGLTSLHGHPDTSLVLLDVNMPNMTGLEFLERVRREPAFGGIRVVLQSTEDTEDDVARGLAAGADAYLAKPFGPPQLYALLDRMLS